MVMRMDVGVGRRGRMQGRCGLLAHTTMSRVLHKRHPLGTGRADTFAMFIVETRACAVDRRLRRPSSRLIGQAVARDLRNAGSVSVSGNCLKWA